MISGFGDFAGAAVVSCILLSMALVLYLFRLRLEGGHGSFVTVTGRAASMPRPPVSARVSIACFAACLLLSILIVLVYGVLLVLFIIFLPKGILGSVIDKLKTQRKPALRS